MARIWRAGGEAHATSWISSNIGRGLLSDFPKGSRAHSAARSSLDHEIDIDVWIPDPYPTGQMRIWPHLRGVRLVLSLMAGTEWIPARWARMSPSAMLTARTTSPPRSGPWRHSRHAQILSVLSRCAASGKWKRRFEASATTPPSPATRARFIRP
jgi:hypothetical protein